MRRSMARVLAALGAKRSMCWMMLVRVASSPTSPLNRRVAAAHGEA